MRAGQTKAGTQQNSYSRAAVGLFVLQGLVQGETGLLKERGILGASQIPSVKMRLPKAFSTKTR